MFGYVVINKPELKFKEFDVYKSFYCGLCYSLRSRYGFVGQFTLSYDMTFLVMLLTSLDVYKRQSLNFSKSFTTTEPKNVSPFFNVGS